MPSGKTHDTITLILALPTFFVVWGTTRSLLLASMATGAMLFSGFMFGPDLDILSRQYTRWGVFRFLWLPYRVVFRHRSRWTHGIVFGTLIRIIYFTGLIALLIVAAVCLRAWLVAGAVTLDLEQMAHAWRGIEAGANAYGLHRSAVLATFAGLWWGAATHTLTDVGWSILRKASEIF